MIAMKLRNFVYNKFVSANNDKIDNIANSITLSKMAHQNASHVCPMMFSLKTEFGLLINSLLSFEIRKI